ncbi:protein tesmin/TSO1-like CXC 5 [Panicum miliaceum]|uniref:Protein tesmin/TSO1-like CXC 5 n=1 Tax=Panicum miliaceum TaxID=4540 RepID=A0A3L6RMC0_PANMI|nr:protein tesmin/TSO1-like CXC 5 [Panicum miliaceum]
MDKPPQLSLGSVHLDIASAFYAGKPEIATTAAALSRALGPAETLPRIQPPSQNLQSPPLLWPRMLNSRNPWTETLSGSKDKTPERIKNCMCKNSKCLKQYCNCFATGRYCKDCNCTNCYNNGSHENARARQDAINAVPERRTAAFMPKAGSRKSECLKKYCGCFQSNVLCSDNCTCMDCKNYESIEDGKSICCIAQKHAVFVQNKQNYALSGILGPSSVIPHTTKNDSVISMCASGILHSISNNGGSSQTLLSFPTSVDDDKGLVSERNTNGLSELGAHEVTYRSVLADRIQVLWRTPAQKSWTEHRVACPPQTLTEKQFRKNRIHMHVYQKAVLMNGTIPTGLCLLDPRY